MDNIKHHDFLYKVGDRVRVRPDLEPGVFYSMVSGRSHCKTNTSISMRCLAGNVCTISDIVKSSWGDHEYMYRIKEDGGVYSWTDEMFSENMSTLLYHGLI